MHLEGDGSQQIRAEDLGKRGSLQHLEVAVLKNVLFDLVVQIAEDADLLFLIIGLDYLLAVEEVRPRFPLQGSRDVDLREVPIELPEVGLEHISLFALHLDERADVVDEVAEDECAEHLQERDQSPL